MDTKLLGLILQGDKRIAREITELKNSMGEAGLTESGAIVQTAAGESIVANDTSDEGLKGLRVFGKTEQFSTSGKNLFNPDNVLNMYIDGASGYTIKSSADARLVYAECEPNTLYTVSKISSQRFIVGYTTELPTENLQVYGAADRGVSTATGITTGENAKYLIAFVYHTQRDTIPEEDVLSSVQIEKGGTATAYEPYTGGIPSPNPQYPQEINSAGDDGDVEVGVYGKNLIPFPYKTTGVKEENGCRFEIQNDGGIACSGTPTGYAVVALANNIPFDTDVAYRLNGNTNNVATTFFLRDENGKDVAAIQLGANRELILLKADYPTARTIAIDIKRASNEVAISGTAYPMLVAGTVPSTDYEPYTKQTLTALTPNGLPGIKVADASLATYTDADGQMWCADEIDFERGVYVKRIDEFDLSAANWKLESYGANVYMWTTLVSDNKKPSINTEHIPVLAEYYRSRKASGMSVSTTGEIATDVTNVKVNTGSGIEKPTGLMYYILATPIETPLTESELTAYRALHSNYPVTTVLNDSGAHMELTYNADTKNYIDNKFTELTNAILSMGGNV